MDPGAVRHRHLVRPSRLVIIDLDLPNAREPDQRTGAASLASLGRERGVPCPSGTFIVRTPSGGIHLYFTATGTPVPNFLGTLGRHIDIGGAGGYVAAPGGRIDGHTYEAHDDRVQPSPLPSWIATVLAQQRAGRRHFRRQPASPKECSRDGPWPTPWLRCAVRSCASREPTREPATTPSAPAGYTDSSAAATLKNGQLPVRWHSITAYNLGIRRNTSLDVEARLPDEVSRRVSFTAETRVVLAHGLNDVALDAGQPRVRIADSLAASARSLDWLASGNIPVLFVGPPPIGHAGQDARTEELDPRSCAPARART